MPLRCALLLLTVLWTSAAWAAEEAKITPDVVYGHKDGLAMTLDVYQPSQAGGAGLMFMMSGGWYSVYAPPEQMLPLFQGVLDRGFTVFCVRHGSSPRYVVPEAVDDVRRAARFVRLHAADYGVDANRLGVYGMSAGGHLSLMLGTTGDDGDPTSPDPVLQTSSRVAAVAALVAPSDLREWVADPPDNIKPFPALRFALELAPGCSPLVHVSADDAPTLLIHGDKDDLVPIAHSQNIHAAFQEHEVESELLTIEGAGHGFGPADNIRAGTALLAWFEKHLAAPAAGE